MADPEDGGKSDTDSSDWAAWIKPRRWLAFAQRVFQAEKQLLTIKQQNEELAARLDKLQRALDVQAGQFLSIHELIDAKVRLAVKEELQRHKSRE